MAIGELGEWIEQGKLFQLILYLLEFCNVEQAAEIPLETATLHQHRTRLIDDVTSAVLFSQQTKLVAYFNFLVVGFFPEANDALTIHRVQVSHPESARIRRQQDLGVVCSWCVSGKSLSFGLDPLFRDINQTEEVPLVSYGGWLRGNYRESSFSSEISLGTWDWNVRVRQGRTVRVGEVFGDMSLGSREYDPEHPHRDPVPATFAVGMGWQSSAAQVRLVSQLDLRSLEQTWMLSVTLLDRHSWFLCGYPAMGQYCSSR